MKVQLGQQRTIIGFSFIWKVFYSWRHFQKHISQGDASTDIRSVDSGGNGMAAIDTMMDLPLHRVFFTSLGPREVLVRVKFKFVLFETIRLLFHRDCQIFSR